MSSTNVFGAPISWVALFAAILGGTSLIPLVFYGEGGGYLSLNIFLTPLVGMVLGPYAGAAAALVGAIIAIFFSPASVPGHIFQMWWLVIPALVGGWMVSGRVRYALALAPFAILSYNIIPFYIPGPPVYGTPPQPFFAMSGWFLYIGILMWFTPLSFKYVPKWLRLGDSKRVFIAYLLAVWMCEPMGELLSGYPGFSVVFNLPPTLVATIAAFGVPWQRALAYPAAAIVASAIIIGMRKAGLRKIPRSILS